jgi:uncharacterized protein YndB with AHSA1/START domain
MTAKANKGSAVVTLPTDTQILITREFDAPAHLVFRAWTTPELIKRWWHANRGVATIADVDLRVGGKWRWVMVTHSGQEVAFHGEYREIVPNERLVSTEFYEAVPGPGAVNTLTLTEKDGRTIMTLLVEHANRRNRDMHVNSGMEDGLQDALDLLEGVAQTME